MVGRNYLLIFLIAVLSAGSVASENQDTLKERSFEDCILHKVDGKIWLQRQIVYLGMVGVMATPPFCLSEDLAAKFEPLISNITDNGEEAEIGYHTRVIHQQKGNLILVSLNAKMREVYDEKFKEYRRKITSGLPDYYEIIEADLYSTEFVSAEWIESWRTIDGILQEIVIESKTSPGKKKNERLAAIFEKGESILSDMIQTKSNEDFRTLVSRVDTNSQVVQTFTRQATFRWQEWFENFATRLGVELNNSLPEQPKLSIALEALANSESLEDFQSAKEKIPSDSLEQLYGFDLGQKIRSLEIGQTKGFKFETLRASAREMLPKIREREENPDSVPEISEKETIEEFGLVLKPVDKAVLTEKQILLGLEVKSVSVDNRITGIQEGDIIIYYDRVNDVVMSWYGLEWQKRILTEIIRQGRDICVMRGDRVINLDVENES